MRQTRRIGDLRGFTRSLALALALAGCARSRPGAPPAPPRVTALDAQSLGVFREHFNAAAEHTRLVALLSPS